MAVIPVRMVRDDFDNVPSSGLPEGFTLRWWRPGDEETWVRLQGAVEQHFAISRDVYDREFAGDAAELARRQCFICEPGGAAIGTATGWYGAAPFDRDWGRVHWVCIDPKYQGRGLGNALMSTVCRRLAEQGHRKAYLFTQTMRGPAISMYLKYGFRPDIRGEPDRVDWRDALPRLDGRSREILDELIRSAAWTPGA
jgi:GNAT superfamily N-acetyltransferase